MARFLARRRCLRRSAGSSMASRLGVGFLRLPLLLSPLPLGPALGSALVPAGCVPEPEDLQSIWSNQTGSPHSMHSKLSRIRVFKTYAVPSEGPAVLGMPTMTLNLHANLCSLPFEQGASVWSSKAANGLETHADALEPWALLPLRGASRPPALALVAGTCPVVTAEGPCAAGEDSALPPVVTTGASPWPSGSLLLPPRW